MNQSKLVEKWNAEYPTGTDVVVRLDSGEMRRTKTRSEAAMLGGHTPVVWLEGIAGAYLLTRVTAASADGPGTRGGRKA